MSIPGALIDVSGLEKLLAGPGCRVVDCRFDLFDADKGRNDYLAGHIAGAVYADMDKDLASEITPETGRHPLPDAGIFCRRLGSWGIDNETHVVAYDYANGSQAARLWWMLRFWLGHGRVSVLDGGIAAWTSEGGKLESEVPRYAPAVFAADPDASCITTTAEIAEALNAGRRLNLIDARDVARFRGEVEPIDTVAGHIPGARNLPLSRNLTAAGRWRGAGELAAIWEDLLRESGDDPAIVMCGSGVTACHLILAASVAGYQAPSLYVGSWSEWIRDEERPVATAEGG